ncbi:MAG: CPBP family intramembrane glutamic endopeptidase [Myxococcota bacterium]
MTQRANELKLPESLQRARARASKVFSGRTDPWADLGLTLPVLLGYHLGVVFLPMRNAADFVTVHLNQLANFSILAYAGLTLLISAIFIGVLVLIGRGKKLHWKRFASVIAEGTLYAVLMGWSAGYLVGSLPLASGPENYGFFSGIVMSFGAGFYEEVAFRVVLFGLGLRLIQRYYKKRATMVALGWAVTTSIVFSAWHYVGAFGDSFTLASFVFRFLCGLAFVAIYRYRGFAPAVWTHTLYDVWVLAL